MVTLYTNDPLQIDILSYKMDLAGVAYEVRKTDSPDLYLVVDGVPLDLTHALKWVDERM